jgi:hypothetical protein
MDIYFDTNVYDHLVSIKNDITEADELALHNAVRSGLISILPSMVNIEEILTAIKKYPDISQAMIRLILSLADFQRVIKPFPIFLRNDIKRYASGKPLKKPFDSDDLIKSNLRDYLNYSPINNKYLLNVLNIVQNEKKEYMNKMKKARKMVRQVAIKFKDKVNSFDDYWNHAEKFATDLAEYEGVIEKCKKRGIRGLLEVRSVRLRIGYDLSYMFAQTFGGLNPLKPEERLKPRIGDSRDLAHAVSASAAEIFVTHDLNFADLLKRIPMDNFEVLDLHGLLGRIS